MALVTKVSKVKRDRYKVHESVRCTYSIFESDGDCYLQLETYGRDSRQRRGQISQSLQFNRASAEALRRALDHVLAPATSHKRSGRRRDLG
jgi:hypothetical protein